MTVWLCDDDDDALEMNDEAPNNIATYDSQILGDLNACSITKHGCMTFHPLKFLPHFHPQFFIRWLFHPQLFHPRNFIPALSSPQFHPHMMMLLKWMMRLQITSRRMIRKSWETWTLAASPSWVSSAKFSVLPIPPSYYYALLKSRTTEGPRIALKFVQKFLSAIRNRTVWISY